MIDYVCCLQGMMPIFLAYFFIQKVAEMGISRSIKLVNLDLIIRGMFLL